MGVRSFPLTPETEVAEHFHQHHQSFVANVALGSLSKNIEAGTPASSGRTSVFGQQGVPCVAKHVRPTLSFATPQEHARVSCNVSSFKAAESTGAAPLDTVAEDKAQLPGLGLAAATPFPVRPGLASAKIAAERETCKVQRRLVDSRTVTGATQPGRFPSSGQAADARLGFPSPPRPARLGNGVSADSGTMPTSTDTAFEHTSATFNESRLSSNGLSSVANGPFYQLAAVLDVGEALAISSGAHFDSLDTDHDGLLNKEQLVKLMALMNESNGLTVRVDDEAWVGLFKKYGLYSDDRDSLGFDEVFALYKYTLRVLRDKYAPKEHLRKMKVVERGCLRLKDRYEDFEFMGKGAFGKIYRCADRMTKERRVCKQIRKDRAAVPIDQCREELGMLLLLDHPHVHRVYQYIEDFNNFYIICDTCDGGELMEAIQELYMKARRVDEGWVAEVMRQLLDAVLYCHSSKPKSILHRDLKPENILLSSRGDMSGVDSPMPQIVIVDFGLSELFMHRGPDPAGHLRSGAQRILEQSNVPAGAFEFTAPEVWIRSFGPKCDVWSCGCILFMLLTGRFPFGHRLTVSQLAQSVLSQDPDWSLFRHASTGALSLCRRMLTKDDQNRPTAQECLRHPWLAQSDLSGGDIRQLRLETLSALVQFHAQSKFHHVVMNLVASELNVGQLKTVEETFRVLDGDEDGEITHEEFTAGLSSLGVSGPNIDKSIRALDMENTGTVNYVPFVAGCVDLVDDKLDHMLWKIFTMIDEDNSGEISTIELEHFLHAACDESGMSSVMHAASSPSDVERYLKSIIDPQLTASEIVARISQGDEIVSFEDLKRYMVEGACSDLFGPIRILGSSAGSEAAQAARLQKDSQQYAPENTTPPRIQSDLS